MAKTNLVVVGHGHWDLSDGNVKTPRNVSVEFYTEFGKNQVASFVHQYLTGSPLANATPDSVIGPFRETQNYSISGLDESDYDLALNYLKNGTLVKNPEYGFVILKKGESSKLANILVYAEKLKFSKIVWMACRSVALKPAGGRALGFNAPQENRKISIEDEINLFKRELGIVPR
jgi:hypothetical protein